MLKAIVVGSGTGFTWMLSTSRPDGLSVVVASETQITSSAGSVVAMDPKLVVVTQSPMPRNPAPVSSTGPITRPVGVIRPVAYLDVDSNRIGGRSKSAHAKQCSKQQTKFFHKILLRISLDDFEPALFNADFANENVRPTLVRSSPARSIFRARELDPLADRPLRLPEC